MSKVPQGGRQGWIDRDEVIRAAQVLLDPDSCHEFRGLPSGTSRLVSLKDIDRLCDVAEYLSDNKGVYFTLNPVRADLGDRGARVDDVLRRRWLLIDVDPERDTDTNSSGAEKAAALLVHSAVVVALKAGGWSDPVLIDSGNGFHALYRVDLPSDEPSRLLLKSVLHKLAADHDSDLAKVDRSVHNASRVSKLPGTWARKGPHSADRPHRLARLISVPDPVEIVTRAQMEVLVGVTAKAEPKVPNVPKHKSPETPLQAWLRKAVEGECGKVAAAPDGDRNNQLQRSAYVLGGLIHAGLDQHDAAVSLLVVGRRVDPQRMQADWEQVIARGLEAGAKAPRDVPDFDKERNGHQDKTAKPQSTGKHVRGPIDYKRFSDADLGIIKARDIKAKSVRWIWTYRLARGTMALMAGDGGLGKSMLALSIASRVSTGGLWPDGSGKAPLGQVIVLSAEDNPEETIKPRLMACGADMDLVTVLRASVTIREEDREPQIHPMSFQDRDYWREVFNRHADLILFAVDPLPSYLGKGVNDSKNNEIRNILEPFLTEIVEPRGICMLCNSHLNKIVDPGRSPVHRIVGSIAYANLPRNVHLVVRDPEDPGLRYFSQAKCNNAPDDLPAIAYRVEMKQVEIDDGEMAKTAVPSFLPDTVSVSLQELVGGKNRRGPGPLDIERATKWLTERLAKGPVGSIICAKEGNEAIGRKWDKDEKYIMSQVKWWRENILKAHLNGYSRRAPVFKPPWFFVLTSHEQSGTWPPSQEAIDAARASELSHEATEATEALQKPQNPTEATEAAPFAGGDRPVSIPVWTEPPDPKAF